MNLVEFKKARTEGRKKLLIKIIKVFKQFKPTVIHQFGSGASGYKDEFSDLDLWITFPKNEISAIVKNQSKIFKSISPVLLKHYSKSWSPKGGSATQIIHITKYGLFQVDYYISTLRKANITKRDIKQSHTFKKDLTLVLALSFIAVKGIIRGWESPDFLNNIKIVYERILESYGIKIKRRKVKLSFKFIYTLLTDLRPLANNAQKKAIDEIKSYTEEVEYIYIENEYLIIDIDNLSCLFEA